ncbi:MAG: LPS-assembly protein LptD [Janthinobacterium lividum]
MLLRPALLAGLALQSVPALAAKPIPAPVTVATGADATTSDKVFKPGDVIEFSSDTMEYSDDDQVVTAIGHVVINRDGNRLTANEVVYNRTTGQVEAHGNVVTIDPQGNQAFGDRVILTESLKDGAIDNILLVLADGGRLAAVSGVRVNGKTTLNRGVYSPCSVIGADGCPREPLWQIKAVRVIHDPAKHRVFYRQARIELFNVPIAYFPTFSHPDGSAGKASGLLVPDIESRKGLGFGIGVPYNLVLSPDRDLTIKPWIFTGTSPALDIRARQLFAGGPVQAQAYFTYANLTDVASDGVTPVDKGDRIRGYFQANGQIQHSDDLRSTFSTRLTTDKTFNLRYGLDYEDSFRTTYNLERFHTDSYLSIAGWAFQSLRAVPPPDSSPIALPLIDYSWRPEDKLLGGQLTIAANSLNLVRTDGQSIQRALASAQWDRSFLTALGQRITATALVRGDLYNTVDPDKATLPIYAGDKGFEGRAYPLAALDAEWAFAGPLLGGSQVITPRVQLVTSPTGLNKGIPDEDSRSVDLDDTNLFALNRFNGYDRVEGGSRVTYGVQYGFNRPRLAITTELGQSYRFIGGTDDFPSGTGLSGNFSDIVGRTTLQYGSLFSITQRFRLDKSSLAIRRNDIDISIGNNATYATIGYEQLNRNIAIEDLKNLQELRLGGRVAILKYWSIYGSGIIDLTTKNEDPTTTTNGFSFVRYRLGVQYEDECFRFGLTLKRDFSAEGDYRAGTGYLLTIAFKNLGR